MLGQVLFLMSAVFAFTAFMANRRANLVSDQLKEINHVLSRDRQINRILGSVFEDLDRLPENDFEDKLSMQIAILTGTNQEKSPTDKELDTLGLLGFPVPIRINLGRGFTDDYIDYLLKGGRIFTSGVSGRDMVVFRTKQDI